MAERKSRTTQHERILAESSSLFWEKGYAETSMKDIAAACGFMPANIYNFFGSKESILFTILFQEMTDIVGPIRHLRDDDGVDPVQALRLVIENHVRLTLGEKSRSRLLFDTGLRNLSAENRRKIIRLRDEYDEIGAAIVRRGKKAGVFSKDVDEKIAIFSIGSIIARSRIWYSPRGKYSVEELIDHIYTFALHGLGSGPSSRPRQTHA